MQKHQKVVLKQRSLYLAILAIFTIVIGLLDLIGTINQVGITQIGYDYSPTLAAAFSGLALIILGGFLILGSVMYDLKSLEIIVE